jgi:hypothetical protein
MTYREMEKTGSPSKNHAYMSGGDSTNNNQKKSYLRSQFPDLFLLIMTNTIATANPTAPTITAIGTIRGVKSSAFDGSLIFGAGKTLFDS